MREASIVCQQFGYTLLPNSWIVKRPQAYNRAQAILYNHVRFDLVSHYDSFSVT